jgi:hypothetical protein
VNDELETKQSWPDFKYQVFCMEGLRKTTKKLSQGNQSPDQDWNPRPNRSSSIYYLTMTFGFMYIKYKINHRNRLKLEKTEAVEISSSKVKSLGLSQKKVTSTYIQEYI